MSKITLSGNASGTGTLTIAAPNTNTDYTLTLPTSTGTVLTDSNSSQAGTFSTLTVNSNNISADNSLGFRNRIINGDMRIDQRNAGASVTFVNTGIYTVDRWKGVEDSDGAMTGQQNSSSPAGFVNSLKCTTTTADGTLSATQYAVVLQAIEGTNISDLAWGTANAKTITLSFWVRSSLTGTFGGSLSNSANNRSYPFTYSISVADTWEQKTITVAGDTSGTWLTTTGIGININFGLGVGSTYSGTAGAWAGAQYLSATSATSVIGTLNATWYITGVQLEVGSVATPFERRPYGTELALCQRYYEIIGSMSGAPYTSTYMFLGASFKVTKRALPTLNLLTTSPQVYQTGTGNFTGSGAANGASNSLVDGCYMAISGFTGLNTSYPGGSITASLISAAAEL